MIQWAANLERRQIGDNGDSEGGAEYEETNGGMVLLRGFRKGCFR